MGTDTPQTWVLLPITDAFFIRARIVIPASAARLDIPASRWPPVVLGEVRLSELGRRVGKAHEVG